MKKIFILSCILLCSTSGVQATNCTKYLSATLSENHNKTIKITSRAEQTDKIENYIGNQFISSVVYGDAKVKGISKRAQKVKYTCLMENDSIAVWGYLFPRQ